MQNIQERKTRPCVTNTIDLCAMDKQNTGPIRRKRCTHQNLRGTKCLDCNRYGICIHHRRTELCPEPTCGGGSLCQEHKQNKLTCSQCKNPAVYCEHGKRSNRCTIHAKLCQHGSIKERCKACCSDYCQHAVKRYVCKECKQNGTGGKGLCRHNVQVSGCTKCGGSQVCQHNIFRPTCEECGGVSICEHGRRKAVCYDCKDAARICCHRKRKDYCIECEGSEMCLLHKRYKRACKQCGHESKKCVGCGLWCVSHSTNYLCSTCNPHSGLRKAYDEKRYEVKVHHYLSQELPYTVYWTGTQPVFSACGLLVKPDIMIRPREDLTIVVEVDENFHGDPAIYKGVCEMKRGFQIASAECGKSIVLIRFSPNKFTVDGKVRLFPLQKRLPYLLQEIHEYVNITSLPPLSVSYLFYPSSGTMVRKVTQSELEQWQRDIL